MAADLARPNADEYLGLLREKTTNHPAHVVKLLEGELLFVRGQKDRALACYRSVPEKYLQAGKRNQIFSRGYYPVEAPRNGRFKRRPLLPLQLAWLFRIWPDHVCDLPGFFQLPKF